MRYLHHLRRGRCPALWILLCILIASTAAATVSLVNLVDTTHGHIDASAYEFVYGDREYDGFGNQGEHNDCIYTKYAQAPAKESEVPPHQVLYKSIENDAKSEGNTLLLSDNAHHKQNNDFASMNIPAGSTVNWATPVSNHAELAARIDAAPPNAAADVFHAIPIDASFALDGTINVDVPNANIILTTAGTDLSASNTPVPDATPAAFELRHGSEGRHFTLSGGARLMLVNIILDGRDMTGAMPPADTHRGGIEAVSGHLTMQRGSVIRHNRAINGGGVHLTDSTLYMFGDARIESNRAQANAPEAPFADTAQAQRIGLGGGVYMTDSHVSMNDSARITDNDTFGSYINHRIPENLPVFDPENPFFIPPAAPFFTNFDNVGHGGGVFMTGGTFGMNDNTRIDANQTSVILENKGIGSNAIADNNAHGGGVFLEGGAVFEIFHANVRIGNNRTNVSLLHYNPSGPAEPTEERWEYIVSHRRIMSARASGSGGGVFVTGADTRFEMHFGQIHNNTANAQGGISGGGGVFITNDAILNMRNDSVIGGDNFAQQNTFVRGGMGAGAVVHNNAVLNMHDTAGITFNNIRIGNNNSGGGVFVNNGELRMYDAAHISNNIGGYHGGGIGMTGGTVQMRGRSAIHNNSVNPGAGHGIGVRMIGGTFEMHDTAGIHNNTLANVVHIGNVVSATTPQRGGGIFIGGGTFTMNGSASIAANRAGHDGGGVFVQGSAANFNLYGGIIEGNDAGHRGGGVYASAAFNLRGTDAKVIAGNEAGYGGGVHVSGQMHMTADANNVSFTDNHARQDGGGIFTTDYEYAHVLTTAAGTAIYYQNITLNANTVFSGNTAGNGSFMPPRNANAAIVSNILFVMPVSAFDHPLNNFDINFSFEIGTPTPAPSPIPSPMPSPVPSPVPSPMPSPVPSPVPSPMPSPVPSPMPSPTPPPMPSPAPSPEPSRETVVIQGAKTWEHGSLSPRYHPNSITIVIRADGQIVLQRVITSSDHWSWAFMLDKYDADGNEIVYMIEELPVPGYTTTINGFDITNTFDPSASGRPDRSGQFGGINSRGVNSENANSVGSNPRTSDSNHLPGFIVLFGVGTSGIVALSILSLKHIKRP
ncbi:MAG: Cna B-type domain-containing protein [Oscillospiraceae bacterium]|nr:Cna B-type domain-containing protein [Oscillospiraceae bacterium]